MKKTKEMNYTEIRTAAAQIECLAIAFNNQSEKLKQKFDELYGYLEFADPARDAAFERFLLTLARAKSLCDVLPALIYQAQLLQKIDLPIAPKQMSEPFHDVVHAINPVAATA